MFVGRWPESRCWPAVNEQRSTANEYNTLSSCQPSTVLRPTINDQRPTNKVLFLPVNCQPSTVNCPAANGQRSTPNELSSRMFIFISRSEERRVGKECR